MAETSIHVPILARVEGEGALKLSITNGKITDLILKIYEPPRFFEQFLVGRHCTDTLDLVARICGICPVAYQMTAVRALESIMQFTPTSWIQTMRRLFYCGEWLESHSMHIHFLAAPDFLGYPSALAMAKDHPHLLQRGIRLQAFGNALIKLLGARSVHPVGACIGGFYRAPTLQQVAELLPHAQQALSDVVELVRWTASLSLPEQTQSFMSVAVDEISDYPMMGDQIVTSKGVKIMAQNLTDYVQEQQVLYSNALYSLWQGEDYLVGPLARLNLHHTKLPSVILDLIAEIKFSLPSNNLFHSIIARAIECYYAVYTAHQILQNYSYPTASNLPVVAKQGIGYGVTEAPRGLLWHRYQLDTQGRISAANIIPPTSQNQARICTDLRTSLESYGLEQSIENLRHYSEMIIRNYDPCISCSTHFLQLAIERQP